MLFGDDMSKCEICGSRKLVIKVTLSTDQSGDIEAAYICLKDAQPIIVWLASRAIYAQEKATIRRQVRKGTM